MSWVFDTNAAPVEPSLPSSLAFGAATAEERAYLHEEAMTGTVENNRRWADQNAYFIYKFELGKAITSLKLDLVVENDTRVEVSYDGAKYVEFANSLTENAPLMSAVINFILAKEGKEEIVVMPYSYKLKTMSDFYLQLLGESLGKKNKCDGSENPLTITPIKAVGVTDQHSQMQLYFEGRNNKTFCFIGQESFDNEFFSSPLDIASYNDNRPQTMGQLLNVERQATMFALYNNNKPCYLITIDEVDEYAVGELIMYFELVTAFMGELMEINAYNQPGVEAGKINTKALLNNKKFRQEKENLLIVREECGKFIINS